MKIIICGATGFVGRNLVPALLKDQHKITLVGRDINKIKNIFKQDIECLTWQQLDQTLPENFDAIINLAGENIAQNRWTASSKKTIIESRVNSTQKITAWCLTSKIKKPHFYNASAIGIYGLQLTQQALPEPLTESTKIVNQRIHNLTN